MTRHLLAPGSRDKLSHIAAIPDVLGNGTVTTIVFSNPQLISGRITLGANETDFVCQAIQEKLARSAAGQDI